MGANGPGKKKGRTATLIAAAIGAIAVTATLLTNIKTIAEFFEPIFGSQSVVPPHKVVRICMGEGGGTNCSSGASASYDCDAYKAMGGGSQKTYDVLSDRFCGYTDKGVRKIYPHNIIVYQNNGGGKCGWTGFEVTCN
jgi:hypothetical protein